MTEGIVIEVPPARYPTGTIAHIIEQILKETQYDLDWMVWVEQKDDRTLEVHYTAVN